MIIYGTMTVDGNTTFSGKLSSGAADGSLHLTSTSSSEVTVNFNSSKNAYTNIYLNGTFVFSPILDGALGPKPATPGANGIFVTDGSPTLFGGTYNNKSFTVNSNRIVEVASGKSLKLASNHTFTLGCPVVAEPTSGYDYSRNTYVQVRDDSRWPGTTLKLSNGGFITAYTFEKESPARSTEQWIGRVEGSGALKYMTQSHVTNSIAPAVDGTIKFESRCDLNGDYEVIGNANGCSCLQVAAGQSISNLTLKVSDFLALDRAATNNHYQILSAPGGFAGKFALPEGWSNEWGVKYTTTGAYLRVNRGLTISIR